MHNLACAENPKRVRKWIRNLHHIIGKMDILGDITDMPEFMLEGFICVRGSSQASRNRDSAETSVLEEREPPRSFRGIQKSKVTRLSKAESPV